MPALRYQLVVMLRTMDNVTVFFGLLILFIFIFSILGMNLFGCKFCKIEENWRGESVKRCERKNFDSLFSGDRCTQNEVNAERLLQTKNVPSECQCERANFDSFLSAFLTVFQILTCEDWNMVLFNGMAQTTPWAALYFVTLMTFGNYVLFNLLVAILVEGFQESKEEEKRQLEEEAQRRAEEEERERKTELEVLIAETTSPEFLDKRKECSCGQNNLQAVREQLMVRGEQTKRMPEEEEEGRRIKPSEERRDREKWTEEEGEEENRMTMKGERRKRMGEKEEEETKRIKPLEDRWKSERTEEEEGKRMEPSEERRDRGKKTEDERRMKPSEERRVEEEDERGMKPPEEKRDRGKGTEEEEERRMKPLEERKDRERNEEEEEKKDEGIKHTKNSERIRTILKKSEESSKQPCSSISFHPHSADGKDKNSRRSAPPQCSAAEAFLSSQVRPFHLSRCTSLHANRRVPYCSSSSAAVRPFPRGHFRPSPLPSMSIFQSPVSLLPTASMECSLVRPRLMSWSHFGCVHSSLFDPQCPVHGHHALLEAYAREKFMKANEELQQTLEEEKRRAEKRKNIWWRRLVRKSFLHSRAEFSLFLLPRGNSLRERCLRLTGRKWFDYAILFCIGLNCVTLAMERPSIPPGGAERLFLTATGYAFTLIFTMEMLLKVLANGCFFGSFAYFKDGWNVLDGILVVISLTNVVIEAFVSGDSPKIFGVIRVLRLLRALRPLRVINRAPGVKLVVMTLISSLKPIGNIVLICCTFFIIFGILGVQLFKGMMFHCVGPDLSNVSTRADCLAVPRNRWVNQRYNFDNLGQALMSLFVLSSKDGWVSIMYQGIDAVAVDFQPIENYNEWRMIYFISFLLLVGFFVLNMFVGVVVDNFHKCKETLEAEMREKARQKQLQRRQKRQHFAEEAEREARKRGKPADSLPYWHRYGPFRLFTHGVITSKYFDLAIAAVIGVNVVSMAMEFYMMPDGLKYLLRTLNYLFTAVFTLEAAMKLYALGLKRFLAERWNQLDMFIVLLSIAGILFEEFEALELPINPTIIRVMRVLRIARVLKLLKMAKGIRSLLDTVGEALPQVGNLGSLFFLLFFIFAALGVELFGRLECSEDHPCDGLGEHAHFKNFGMAFLTLFRIATGDNWNGIMKDALRDDCDPSDHCERNCCVDPILAPCFFVVFVLISQFVLVNVVVAVLMKHLEESNKRDEATDAKAAEEEKAARVARETDAETEELLEEEAEIEAEEAEEEADEQQLGEELLAHIERDLFEVEQRLAESGRRSASERGSVQIFDVSAEFIVQPLPRVPFSSVRPILRRRSSPPRRFGEGTIAAPFFVARHSLHSGGSRKYRRSPKQQPTEEEEEDEDTLGEVDAELEFGWTEAKSGRGGELQRGISSDRVIYEVEEHPAEEMAEDEAANGGEKGTTEAETRKREEAEKRK
ncbi:hypothetical protein niasHS_002294 [Heterodera schachtii]|uniref:Ion transport domain-containing protein n=1 Tax=Heterodera schachtii TaxID=97005 RepID=A0ABD2KJU5_HETSC